MKKLILALVMMTSSNVLAGGGSSIGPANPASEHCLKIGGTLERYTTPQGEGANCVIEEWTLYRVMANQGLLANSDQFVGGLPNVASANCERINGAIRFESTEAGQWGICVVEEWDLYRAMNSLK